MRINLLTYLLAFTLIFGVSSCSEHDDMQPATEGRVITVTLRVPSEALVTVGSRAFSDTEVSSVSVLVFDDSADDARLLHAPERIKEFSMTEDGRLTFNMRLAAGVPDHSRLTFVFLANVSDEALTGINSGGVTTLSSLRSRMINIEDAVRDTIAMSGCCGYDDMFGAQGKTVVLYRNVARVEAVMKQDGTLVPFTIYGAPASLSLTAGCYSDMPVASSEELSPSVTVSVAGKDFVAPARNNSSDDPMARTASPFMVVKASYEGTDYYYRLQFVKNVDNRNVALDLLPNHHYRFVIQSVTAPGYATVDEAAEGVPSSAVNYMIYDIQPQIFSMASDGVVELGVSDRIVDSVGDECVKQCFVKCMPSPKDVSELTFTPDVDWISVDPKAIAATPVEDYDGQEGMLYTFNVHLSLNPFRTSREGALTVSWHGLSVNIPVLQDRTFIADQHTSVSLGIFEEDGSLYREINDYWKFLKGVGSDSDPGISGATIVAPRLYGVGGDANGGVVRTQGLHFPVMNGGRNYSYTVLPDFDTASGAAYYCVSLTSGSVFTGKIEYDDGMLPVGTPVVITYINDDYKLLDEQNCLLFTSYDGTGRQVENLAMDIYHRGIFDWSDYPTYRSDRTNDPKIEQAWYYYEVERFDAGGESMFWLDRNVGARSRGFDVTDAIGLSIFTDDSAYPFLSGDESAMGGMYHSIANESYVYGNPELKADFGPKGYEIPSMASFNEVRNSENFITSRAYTSELTMYYQAYFKAANGRNVYFPKGGQYQNAVLTSEGQTGHYWTSTVASGFEKEEVGKWLTTMVISGNSTYFSRARILNPLTAMSVRLRNVSDSEEQSYQTFLSVKGATHVFLYRDNGDSREWVAAWPGVAVANPDIAFDKSVNYVYESARDVKYMVIFNYVSESGAICTMAQADSQKGINAVGWEASGTFVFDEEHNRIE